MKKQLFGIILAGLLLFSFITLAQNNNYPVTTVHGVEYYQYTIESGEGLLSIGRKFNLSQEEITKANPEVKSGLKVGQQILIPVPKKSAKKSTTRTNSAIQFVQHKVEKKQTLFSISRKYQVNEEDIIKYNPEIAKGLKEGIVLQIPKPIKENIINENPKSSDKNTKTTKDSKNENTQKFTLHKVQSNETLFSISRRYKVDITDIIRLNPGCDSRLVVGSELKIQTPGTSTTTKAQKKDNTVFQSKKGRSKNQ